MQFLTKMVCNADPSESVFEADVVIVFVHQDNLGLLFV
jgi:hypothetical protein